MIAVFADASGRGQMAYDISSWMPGPPGQAEEEAIATGGVKRISASIWNSLVDQAAVVACESSGPPCFDRSRGRNDLI